MKIQVLGSGCPTCKSLFELTQKAVMELKLDTQVEYISGSDGLQKIIELGAMSSPVLAIDGKIAMVGFTPNIEKVKELITSGIDTSSETKKCDCGSDCC